MSPEPLAELEEHRKYLENRARFPVDELIQYMGQWIAWSPDGEKIVAHAASPEELDELIRDAGGDPERCIVGRIPDEDTIFGSGLLL